MSNEQDRHGQHGQQDRSGGIEPLWDPSWAVATAFDWRREGQMEQALERLRIEQGELALRHFGSSCVDRVVLGHQLLPKVLAAAADGLESADERSRGRSAYGGAASAAHSIGLKHGMEGAAAFLAGFRLFDDCPVLAVANAAAFARLSLAFRARTRLLNRLPSRDGDGIRRRRPRGVPARSVAVELSALHSIDPDMARAFAGRLAKPGGERTRLVVGRIAAVEAEARAWDEQRELLENLLDEGKEPR